MPEADSGNNKFKLKDELQKRKTQETRRTMVADQVKRAQGGSPPRSDAKRTAQTAPLVPSKPSVIKPLARSSRQAPSPPSYQSITRNQKIWLTVVIAGALVILVGMASISLASSHAAVALSPTPWSAPQNVDMASVLAYLAQVGLPPTNVRQYDPTSNRWHAQDEREFDLVQGTNKADVIVLTYPSRDKAIPDTFGMSKSAKFKDWHWMTLANVTVLVSPDTEAGLRNEIFGHITQFIMAPNHPLWPTATPSATLGVTPTLGP